jgi:hypothetical protein
MAGLRVLLTVEINTEIAAGAWNQRHTVVGNSAVDPRANQRGDVNRHEGIFVFDVHPRNVCARGKRRSVEKVQGIFIPAGHDAKNVKRPGRQIASRIEHQGSLRDLAAGRAARQPGKGETDVGPPGRELVVSLGVFHSKVGGSTEGGFGPTRVGK